MRSIVCFFFSWRFRIYVGWSCSRDLQWTRVSKLWKKIITLCNRTSVVVVHPRTCPLTFWKVWTVGVLEKGKDLQDPNPFEEDEESFVVVLDHPWGCLFLFGLFGFTGSSRYLNARWSHPILDVQLRLVLSTDDWNFYIVLRSHKTLSSVL